MTKRKKIIDLLYEIVGEETCDNSRSEYEIYQENGEWKLFLCNFIEPWPIGKTLAEVETNLWEMAESGSCDY